jgi:hypothetical protein
LIEWIWHGLFSENAYFLIAILLIRIYTMLHLPDRSLHRPRLRNALHQKIAIKRWFFFWLLKENWRKAAITVDPELPTTTTGDGNAISCITVGAIGKFSE